MPAANACVVFEVGTREGKLHTKTRKDYCDGFCVQVFVAGVRHADASATRGA